MRLAAAAVALVMALSACSSEEAGPKTLPPLPSGEATATAEASSTAASTPAPVLTASSPSPPPAVPSFPDTAVGATNFARYFLDELTLAFQRADARRLRDISDAGCGGCQNLIRAVEGARAAGERVQGGVFAVVFAEAPPVENAETIVELRYRRSSGYVIDDGGATVGPLTADAPLDAQMRLQRRGDSWVVLGLRASTR